MRIFGVSLDSVVDLSIFAEEQELNFRLLSDPDGSAATKYGVFAGRFANRVTFVLDEKGVLRHIDQSVEVTTHGADLVEVVRKLQG